MAGWCFPGSARGAEIREVTVRVFIKGRVSIGDLGKALREAEAIYSETGIAMRWEEGSIEDHDSMALDFSANGALGGVCPETKSGRLNLLLVRGPANSSGSPTLGLALPCAKFGSHALVLLILTYQVLSTGQAYQEKQVPISDPRHKQRIIRHHIRRLGKLGVRVYGQHSSSSATASSPTTGD
jgi:hypothetical protein